MSGTLVTIAKDVKIQVEFNPAIVGAYRLIGYENRMLAARDFKDDKKDAGEIGAGHTVTALYELVPAGQETGQSATEPLKYARPKEKKPAANPSLSPESFTVRIRFKAPEGDVSKQIDRGFVDEGRDSSVASGDFKFAAAVASFGMLLRDAPHKGSASYSGILELAETGVGDDPSGYRKEFLNLVRSARTLAERAVRY